MTSLRRRPLKSLHLYRALLRETSYLPDTTARAYFKGYIVAQFREAKKTYHDGSFTEAQLLHEYDSPSHHPQRRINLLLDKAERGLRDLRNANHGVLRSLKKVLAYAYGRAGKRRHELLATFRKSLAHREYTASETSTSASQYLKCNKNFATFYDWDSSLGAFDLSRRVPQFRLLVNSTRSHKPSMSLRKRIRLVRLIPPSTNIWGKPLVRSRLTNILHDFHADLLDRLQPPLPRGEFEHLRGLVSGEIRWEGVRPRRPGLPPADAKRLGPYELQHALSNGTALGAEDATGACLPGETDAPATIAGELESSPHVIGEPDLRSKAMDLALEHVLQIRNLRKPLLRDRPHNVTLRLMKRLWGMILEQSCYEVHDAENDSWDYIWGDSTIARRKINSLRRSEHALFEGVNERGKLLKT